jgi:hypothetical protein
MQVRTSNRSDDGSCMQHVLHHNHQNNDNDNDNDNDNNNKHNNITTTSE